MIFFLCLLMSMFIIYVSLVWICLRDSRIIFVCSIVILKIDFV